MSPKPPPSKAPVAWLHRPQVQRVVYPLLVGLFLLALWQGLVTGLELPPYLVPSPGLMFKTLIQDWATLGLALWVTLKITLFAFALAVRSFATAQVLSKHRSSASVCVRRP